MVLDVCIGRVFLSAPELSQYYSEKDGDGRGYKHPLTGERLPSVTTILKMADKAGLVQWSANLTLEWAIANWHLLGSRSDEDATKAGRYRWKDVRDERAEVGTGIHETIEALHTGSWDFPALDEEQDRIMAQWHQLELEHEIVPVKSEVTVWNPGLYAGTADGIWMVDGVLSVIDIKTSKNHWPEHDCQLAALWNAPIIMEKNPDGTWQEVPRMDYKQALIIHLREDKHDIIKVENLDLHYSKFLGYHQVYSATQALKQREKQNGGK